MRPAAGAAVKVRLPIFADDIPDLIVRVTFGAVASRIGIHGFHQTVELVVFKRLIGRIHIVRNGQDIPRRIVRVIQVLHGLQLRVNRVQTREAQI